MRVLGRLNYRSRWAVPYLKDQGDYRVVGSRSRRFRNHKYWVVEIVGEVKMAGTCFEGSKVESRSGAHPPLLNNRRRPVTHRARHLVSGRLEEEHNGLT
jgi:hypothetical protein